MILKGKTSKTKSRSNKSGRYIIASVGPPAHHFLNKPPPSPLFLLHQPSPKRATIFSFVALRFTAFLLIITPNNIPPFHLKATASFFSLGNWVNSCNARTWIERKWLFLFTRQNSGSIWCNYNFAKSFFLPLENSSYAKICICENAQLKEHCYNINKSPNIFI